MLTNCLNAEVKHLEIPLCMKNFIDALFGSLVNCEEYRLQVCSRELKPCETKLHTYFKNWIVVWKGH